MEYIHVPWHFRCFCELAQHRSKPASLRRTEPVHRHPAARLHFLDIIIAPVLINWTFVLIAVGLRILYFLFPLVLQRRAKKKKKKIRTRCVFYLVSQEPVLQATLLPDCHSLPSKKRPRSLRLGPSHSFPVSTKCSKRGISYDTKCTAGMRFQRKSWT